MKVCRESGCDKKVLARGLCTKHYASARKAGTIKIGASALASRDVCDCGQPTMKVGRYCKPCCLRVRAENAAKQGRSCKADGCDSTLIEGKGYCQKHYLQVRKHGKTQKYGRYEGNRVVKLEEVSLIYCTDMNGQVSAVCKVDTDDIELLKQYRWGFDKTNGYVLTQKGFQGKKCSIQRVIIGDKDTLVDHISGDKLDNRRSNLRVCQVSTNSRNSRQGFHGTVPDVKGVYYDKTKDRYVAGIILNGKKRQRYFVTKQEAVECRKAMAEKYHGEFAYENRPKNETSSSI